MQEPLIESRLLSSIPGLTYGFRANHTAGGREALDALEPSIATVKQIHTDHLVWTGLVEKRAREADAIAARGRHADPELGLKPMRSPRWSPALPWEFIPPIARPCSWPL